MTTQETHKHNMPECFKSAAYIKSYGLKRWMDKNRIEPKSMIEAMGVTPQMVSYWRNSKDKKMPPCKIDHPLHILYAHGLNGLRDGFK